MSFDTPLRYPGGKGRLTNYIAEILKLNRLEGGCYAEPFSGGAGIAVSLLLSEYIRRVHLNDLDRSVYAFWHSVLNRNEELCALVDSTGINMETWQAQRKVQADKEAADLLELGFSTFFLNRTNRSGILTAGVIGGLNQEGNYKIDARFNKPELIKRIRAIGRYASRITLSQLDAEDFIYQIVPTLPQKSLVYFDPPYFKKGQGLYQNHYRSDDHGRLAAKILNIQDIHWLVSYDNVPEIAALYTEREQEIFSLNYSAQGHYKGTELMVFSKHLDRPDSVYASRGRVA